MPVTRGCFFLVAFKTSARQILHPEDKRSGVGAALTTEQSSLKTVKTNKTEKISTHVFGNKASKAMSHQLHLAKKKKTEGSVCSIICAFICFGFCSTFVLPLWRRGQRVTKSLLFWRGVSGLMFPVTEPQLKRTTLSALATTSAPMSL